MQVLGCHTVRDDGPLRLLLFAHARVHFIFVGFHLKFELVLLEGELFLPSRLGQFFHLRSLQRPELLLLIVLLDDWLERVLALHALLEPLQLLLLLVSVKLVAHVEVELVPDLVLVCQNLFAHLAFHLRLERTAVLLLGSVLLSQLLVLAILRLLPVLTVLVELVEVCFFSAAAHGLSQLAALTAELGFVGGSSVALRVFVELLLFELLPLLIHFLLVLLHEFVAADVEGLLPLHRGLGDGLFRNVSASQGFLRLESLIIFSGRLDEAHLHILLAPARVLEEARRGFFEHLVVSFILVGGYEVVARRSLHQLLLLEQPGLLSRRRGLLLPLPATLEVLHSRLVRRRGLL
mmetsp:Transcript_1411/g.1892  ORF Transcript_1411/g.1892 Transcript_1411/m.1892 type:complete len:349 (-) Transcript_1411:456-1502(-)